MALRWGSDVPQCNIVTRMPLATIALLCKQITNDFRFSVKFEAVVLEHMLINRSIHTERAARVMISIQ